MALLTIRDEADAYTWWPNLLNVDPFVTEIEVVRSATLVVLSWLAPGGTVKVSFAGSGFVFSEGVFPDGERALDGTVSSMTVAVDEVALLTIGSLSVEAADIDHLWFGFQRWDRYQSGDSFDLLTFLLAGNDQILGSDDGDDLIAGRNPGDDTILGGGGSDFIKADMGSDRIDGGAGFDTYSLSETFFDAFATRGAVIDLGAGTATDSWGGRDILISVEEVHGSRFADRITAGDDGSQLMGLKGRDTLIGGSGFDEVMYWADSDFGGARGIVVDLAAGFVRDGWGQRDQIVGIESVIGTGVADRFMGSAGDDQFLGGAGVDTYDGRGGWDKVNFSWGPAQTGAVVDLRLATGQVLNDGFGNVETLVRIEALDGNELNDRLIGNSAANELVGDRGDDTLIGNGGNDTLQGDAGADVLTGGAGSDVFVFTRREGNDPWGDRITDFVSGTDKLAFEIGDFPEMDTTLRFQNGGSAGAAGEAWFYFDSASRRLFWDADGIGGVAAIHVATLTGVSSLAITDFVDTW